MFDILKKLIFLFFPVIGHHAFQESAVKGTSVIPPLTAPLQFHFFLWTVENYQAW